MLIFSQLKYKSIILLVPIFLFASFSFCHASKSLESKKQFVSDVQGVYQTTLNAGGVEYRVRVIIRNRIGINQILIGIYRRIFPVSIIRHKK